MQKVLFFHGGPAFNGNPERNLLTASFQNDGFELICWDEPSAMRPSGYPFKKENAFANYLQSAEAFLLENFTGEPLILAGFCFGVHLLPHLVNRHAEKISNLVVITPDFCVADSDLNILTYIAKDYRDHNDPPADEMEKIVRDFSGKFDANTERGWWLVSENPRMFTYYWRTAEMGQRFMQYYTGDYAIDVESFFSVRRSWFETQMQATDIPTLVIYGTHDQNIDIEKEIAAVPRRFLNYKIFEIKEAGHYPHIETEKELLAILKRELR